MIDISTVRWHQIDDTLPSLISQALPNSVKHWVLDSDSLTAKLRAVYPAFNVELITNEPENASEEVADILGTLEVYRREVYLCSNKTRLVYAVSFIPKACHELLELGNTPLGEVLFNSATRKSIELSLTKNTPGRRSIFQYKSHRIIVCEFFITPLRNQS